MNRRDRECSTWDPGLNPANRTGSGGCSNDGPPTVTGGGTGNRTKQNPYLYKSAIQDRASGLQKFGTCWYNPATGTWTQQGTLDTPLGPANANRCAYTYDGPINNADPSGQINGCKLVGLILGIGALVLGFAGVAIVAAVTEGGGLARVGGALAVLGISRSPAAAILLILSVREMNGC